MIFRPIMCMYISCVGLCVHGFINPLPSWFVCIFFFSDVLTYCVMLLSFICYCSSSDVYDVRARVCFFIGIVQRSWACLTWKSAIEIKSWLLLLLLWWAGENLEGVLSHVAEKARHVHWVQFLVRVVDMMEVTRFLFQRFEIYLRSSGCPVTWDKTEWKRL